jgi:Tol biopolymer transport system component
LNNSNIAHIHGFEDSNGIRALVLELVEGPTLADRIAQGPIPVDEALRIAKQVADALEAAHDSGIVHRDLKPANIKVRPDGTVKILDFGLAKALDSGPTSSADAMNSPTFTGHETRMGVILGTAAYMAPEQAKGRAVDKHADIWAFGVVLFEMLTATRAFAGDDVSETVAAVIKSDPDWTALPADTPFLIRRLLRHCLVKDPRQRLGDIRDARLEIAETLAGTPAQSQPLSRQVTRRERLAWIAAAVFGIAMIAVAMLFALGAIRLREPFAPKPVVRFTITAPAGSVATGAPVISPDGRRIVFVATAQNRSVALWVRALDSVTAQPLAGTEGAFGPFWSPDSRSIGFFTGSALKKIDVAGGPAVTVCDAPTGFGGTWSSGGTILFAPEASSGLRRVSAAGGPSTAVTSVTESAEVSHRWPQFLPDGNHFLYLSTVTPGLSNGIFLSSLDSPNTRRLLLTTDSRASYAAPGVVLFVRGTALMRQPFDTVRLELTGDAVPVADTVGVIPGGDASFSAADNEILVYGGAAAQLIRRLVWVDRRGGVTPLNLPPGRYSDPSLSPDGRFVAFTISDPTGDHIWVYDIERGTLGKRTFEGANGFPIWTRDGRYLVFSRAGRAALGTLVRVPADGSGRPEPLVTDALHPGAKVATSWSSDGRLLAFQNGQDIVVRDADGKMHDAVATTAYEREGRFAPDSRWMAYRSNETGRDEVYVQSYPPGKGKWQISNDGGAQPVWGPDGRELFYKNGNRMMVVNVEAGDTFTAGTPRVLFEMPFAERQTGDPSRFTVSPDAKRFLVTTTVGSAEAPASPPFQVVINWPELVKTAGSIR